MCGICGLAGNGIVQKDLDVLVELLQVSTVRGQHGTGIAQAHVHRDGKGNTNLIQKNAMEVNSFLRYHLGTKEGNQLLLRSCFDNVFIGHVRQPTRGDVSVKNTHPFKIHDLIGCHNGTLTDWRFIKKDITDSELLIQTIEKNGTAKTLTDLEESNAFAIVTLDVKTGQLTFVRNKHRPLHLAFNKHRAVMYWASEYGMLEWILDRNKIQYEEILEFKENRIYTIYPWEISQSESHFKAEDFYPKAQFIPKKKKKDKYSTHYTGIDYDYDSWFIDKKKAQDSAEVLLGQDEIPFGEPTEFVPRENENVLKFKKKGEIPRNHCISCGVELNLVDQYFADKVTTKDGTVLFDCKECVVYAEEQKLKDKQELARITS